MAPPQPPPGGWPNRRRDDIRLVQQAEEIRLLKLDLRAAQSHHADYENDLDYIKAKGRKNWEIAIIIATLVSTGFGWAIYTSGFAKADELKKTQEKVSAQDASIAEVRQAVLDLTKQADRVEKKLDKLVERSDAGRRR